ncbi:MAG: esterase-like activity of phytase family protein [Sulfuricaulis sp.]
MKHFLKAASMIAGVLCTGFHNGVVLAQTELETRQVSLSPDIKIGDRIGRIRFLGMLQLPDITRNGLRLSQLSGLAWDDDDGVLYAISDKGGLFHLKPEFDGNTLTGLRLLRAVALQDPANSKLLKRPYTDSEDLDVLNGHNGRKGDAELVISFERAPRITRYQPDGRALGDYPLPEPLNNAKNYASTNRMLESVCVDSSLGIITVPEEPLKNEQSGYTHIFSLSKESWLYPIASGDRLTAMECLGQGEVILLQQTYLRTFGQITVALKRIRLTSTPSLEALKPETLVALDNQKGFQIDNFEGLARHNGNRFFMVSDNNDLFIQRTLLMYFELLDE